jgi:hypothetical protein
VIGTAAVAGSLVGAGFVFTIRPGIRSVVRAALIAVPAAIVAAFVAHTMTAS